MPNGTIHITNLCEAVDPSVLGQTLHAAQVMGLYYELRLVYIANDDLTFINQCTQIRDKDPFDNHREPYYSTAESSSGQTFIIFLANEPICVAEVHHALQHFAGDEFTPEETDYMLDLFFAPTLDMPVHAGVIQFFKDFCRQFPEVGDMIIKADIIDEAALAQAGFAPKNDAMGAYTGYYYSTSKENV